jgi:hypothetical protein
MENSGETKNTLWKELVEEQLILHPEIYKNGEQ